MSCATEMGATLGTCNQEIIEDLARFGHALGLAFQVRDDMLGVWATESESGKLPLVISTGVRKACLSSMPSNMHNQTIDR